MEKRELDRLFDLTHVAVADLCKLHISLTAIGIRVCICEKDVTFTIEELTACQGSVKDFLNLIQNRIWRAGDKHWVAKLEDENEELRKTVERLEAELIDYRRREE